MTGRIPRIDRYNHQIVVMISRIKWIASKKKDEVYSNKIIWSTKRQRNEQIWNLGNRMIPPEINAFCGELRATCRQEIKKNNKKSDLFIEVVEDEASVPSARKEMAR